MYGPHQSEFTNGRDLLVGGCPGPEGLVSAILFSVISEIWRYPVKSMVGESLVEVVASECGLAGDRSWAVVDEASGLVASAKHPRKWGRLLTCASAMSDEGGHIDVSFPDGKTGSTSSRDELNDMLSEFFETRVALTHSGEIKERTLERTDPNVEGLLNGEPLELAPVATGPLGTGAPAGTLFDFAPIHIIARATLRALESSGGPTSGDARRFRPNLVLDVDGPAFQENDWPGKLLEIEGGVTLEFVVPTPRCIVPSLPQNGLERSIDTIRSVAQLNRIEIEGHGIHSCIGAYAKVTSGGTLTRGTGVQLIPH